MLLGAYFPLPLAHLHRRPFFVLTQINRVHALNFGFEITLPDLSNLPGFEPFGRPIFFLSILGAMIV